MKHLLIFSIICFSLLLFACTNKAERENNNQHTTIQWRGVDRTGIFHETGLMISWYQDGPELLWYV